MAIRRRFDVCLVSLDPTVGSEIQKRRPCVIVSPDEMNEHLSTVIIAPMTTTIKKYPSRVNTRFQNKRSQVVLDQIRTVDNQRLVQRLGKVDPSTASSICRILKEMFGA